MLEIVYIGDIWNSQDLGLRRQDVFKLKKKGLSKKNREPANNARKIV